MVAILFPVILFVQTLRPGLGGLGDQIEGKFKCFTALPVRVGDIAFQPVAVEHGFPADFRRNARDSLNMLLFHHQDQVVALTQCARQLLGDVPVVGNLFKSRTKESSKREMLVFITPKVITDRGPVR